MKIGNIFGGKAKLMRHPLVMSCIRLLFSVRTAGSIFFLFFTTHFALPRHATDRIHSGSSKFKKG